VDERFNSLNRIIVTDHAQDMYQLHHPDSSVREIKQSFIDSILIDEGLGRALCGRYWDPKKEHGKTFFRISRDRKGEFVSVYRKDEYYVYIVTYLRFGGEQQAFVWKHFPPETLTDTHLYQAYKDSVYKSVVYDGDLWSEIRSIDLDQSLNRFKVSKGITRAFGSKESAVRYLVNNAEVTYSDEELVELSCKFVYSGIAISRSEKDTWRIYLTDRNIPKTTASSVYIEEEVAQTVEVFLKG